MKELSRIQKITLAIIVVVGAILRLYNYSGWSLSNDELSALNRLHYESISQVIEQGVKLNDMHPPGVQAFLFLWTSWFGVDENVLRLPFVLFGIASVFMLFLVAKNWFNANIALVVTASFSTLIFPILYSQLARPYSPGLFFSLLAIYFWTKLLFQENKNHFPVGNYIGFILSGAACMYIHYFSFLFLVLIGIAGFFYLKGKKLWYIIAGAAMLLLLAPYFSVYLYQIGIGGLGGTGGWLGKPNSNAILQLISYIFNDSLYLLLFYFVVTIFFIFYTLKEKTNLRFRRFSLVLFLTPFIIAYFYSILKNPVYQHSIMIFSFPYLLLFVFSFLPSDFSDKKTFLLSMSILIITGLSTVAEKKIYSTQYFGVFKELAEKTIAYKNKYGDNNITSVANVIFPYYINYYHEKQKSEATYKIYSCSAPEQLQKLDEIARESVTPYFSYVWSNTYNPEEVQQILSQYYPKLIDRIDYFNSGVRLFAKSETKTPGAITNPSFYYLNDFENPSSQIDSLMQSDSVNHSGKKSILYSAENEYGPTYKQNLHSINFKDSCTIWLKVWVYSDEIAFKASLVLQVDDQGKTILWRGTDLQDYIVKPSTWHPVYLAYKFSESMTKDAVVSAYVWNSGKSKFYIDDFSVTVIP